MAGFSGIVKLRVLEAIELQAANVRSQFNVGYLTSIDPFLQVNVDDENVARTCPKTKTFSPQWNEDFSLKVHNAKIVSATVFHNATVGPNPFVATVNVPLQEIIEEGQPDLWVCFKPLSTINI